MDTVWILFGTPNYCTVEGELFVYFIAAFDGLEKANMERERLTLYHQGENNTFFVKCVNLNQHYDYADLHPLS